MKKIITVISILLIVLSIVVAGYSYFNRITLNVITLINEDKTMEIIKTKTQYTKKGYIVEIYYDMDGIIYKKEYFYNKKEIKEIK